MRLAYQLLASLLFGRAKDLSFAVRFRKQGMTTSDVRLVRGCITNGIICQNSHHVPTGAKALKSHSQRDHFGGYLNNPEMGVSIVMEVQCLAYNEKSHLDMNDDWAPLKPHSLCPAASWGSKLRSRTPDRRPRHPRYPGCVGRGSPREGNQLSCSKQPHGHQRRLAEARAEGILRD